MGNYELLKAAINEVIKANGRQEITGEVLNQVLLSMVNSLGAGYQCMGVATPSTNPGTPDQNVFYFATQAGTYTNFDAIVLQAGISVLIWDGDWASQTWFTVDSTPTNNSQNLIASGAVFNALKLDGGAYDVSAHNSGAMFASLSELLNSANLNTLIPTEIRHGGMSIKYVQSSDNKYIQARCMAQNFTTDVTQWQGVDDVPTAGSENLVKSGGVDYRTGSLQSNIDNITGINNKAIDLSSYPEKDYYLGDNDIWRANANYGLKIIPIYSLQGGSITIKANDNTEFAFLKQDNLGNGNTADICDGTTKRYCAPNSTTTVIIPDDCNYIYIYTRSGSVDKSPQSVTITKKGMLYTSVIKTDADINIQSETLNDILRIFDKDANVVVYDDLKPYSGWIGENGYEAVGNQNRLHKVVAIKGGATIIINTSTVGQFYVVKSYTVPTTSGETPDFATGETGRRSTTANKDYVFTAPSDANYIVFGVRYDSSITQVNKFTVNGYDVTKSLKYNLISLKSSSISDFDGNTDISATTLNEVIEKQNADVECTTYDNLKQHSGWIGENGYEAVGYANRTHKVVKVKGKSKISIRSRVPVPFYVVKSYSAPTTSGETPDLATGETGRRMTKAGENFSFVLPSDAEYLIFGYKYDNAIHDIYKIVVDGYNVIDSIKENLLQPSIGSDYEGEKISICKKFRLENLPAIIGGQYHQGCAIYGNYMFVVGNSVEENNVATIPVYIVNLTAASVESTINLPYDTIFPHCSGICFSRTFVEGSDFPLLYVSVNKVDDGRGCLVYSITNTGGVWSMALVQTISVNIDSTQFGAGDNAWVVDCDENKLYSFAFTLNQPYYTNIGNSMKVCVFDLPSIANSSITLTSSDVKDDYELEHFTYFQDVCYSCGKIYVASGGGSSYASTNILRVIDTLQRKVVSRVRYPEVSWEVEGLDIHNGDLLMFGNKIFGLKFVFD